MLKPKSIPPHWNRLVWCGCLSKTLCIGLGRSETRAISECGVAGDVTYFHFLSLRGPPQSATLNQSKDICKLVGGTGHWMFSLSDIRNRNCSRADFDLFIASILFFPVRKAFSLISVMCLQSTYCSPGWPADSVWNINRSLRVSLKRLFQHKLGWDAYVCCHLGGFADDSCPFLSTEARRLLYADTSAAVIVQEDARRTQMIQREMCRNMETDSFDYVLPSMVSQLWQKSVKSAFTSRFYSLTEQPLSKCQRWETLTMPRACTD